MKNKNTSLRNEQEPLFLVPGRNGTDWNATKANFIHLAKIGYYFSVSQCDKLLALDDMRDPDAIIDEALRDNMDPVVSIVRHMEKKGMPDSICNDILHCDWLKMTKTDVIRELSVEAQKMRKRKLHLRKNREERRKNGFSIIVD